MKLARRPTGVLASRRGTREKVLAPGAARVEIKGPGVLSEIRVAALCRPALRRRLSNPRVHRRFHRHLPLGCSQPGDAYPGRRPVGSGGAAVRGESHGDGGAHACILQRLRPANMRLGAAHPAQSGPNVAASPHDAELAGDNRTHRSGTMAA
jgi:hypothetical protein